MKTFYLTLVGIALRARPPGITMHMEFNHDPIQKTIFRGHINLFHIQLITYGTHVTRLNLDDLYHHIRDRGKQ